MLILNTKTLIMKTTFKNLAMIFGAALVLASCQEAGATLSWSSPLTLSSPNLVGIADGVTANGNGSPAFKMAVGQALLDLAANATVTTTVGGAANTLLKTSTTTDYNGTIVTSSYISGTTSTYVAAGYEYVVAKYDGQNAGYIMFYLGGQDANLPQFPANFWTTGNSLGISGWVAFNATPSDGGSPIPEPSTVVAGALLLLPLGVASLRRLRKQ
jgi:hypothetical protein